LGFIMRIAFGVLIGLSDGLINQIHAAKLSLQKIEFLI